MRSYAYAYADGRWQTVPLPADVLVEALLSMPEMHWDGEGLLHRHRYVAGGEDLLLYYAPPGPPPDPDGLRRLLAVNLGLRLGYIPLAGAPDPRAEAIPHPGLAGHRERLEKAVVKGTPALDLDATIRTARTARIDAAERKLSALRVRGRATASAPEAPAALEEYFAAELDYLRAAAAEAVAKLERYELWRVGKAPAPLRQDCAKGHRVDAPFLCGADCARGSGRLR